MDIQMSELRKQTNRLRFLLNEFPLVASVVEVSQKDRIEQQRACEKLLNSRLLVLKSIKLLSEKQEDDFEEVNEDLLLDMTNKVILWRSILDLAVYNDKLYTLIKNEDISDKEEHWKRILLKQFSNVMEKHEKLYQLIQQLSDNVHEVQDSRRVLFEEITECRKKVTSDHESSRAEESKEYQRLKQKVDSKIIKINFMRLFMLKIIIHTDAMKSTQVFDMQRTLRFPITYQNVDKQPTPMYNAQ